MPIPLQMALSGTAISLYAAYTAHGGHDVSEKPTATRTGHAMREAKFAPSKYGAHLSAAARRSGLDELLSTILGQPLSRPAR